MSSQNLRDILQLFVLLQMVILIKDIVYNGILKDNGMSSFSDVLSENDVESIYHYIVDTAKIDRQVQLEQNN